MPNNIQKSLRGYLSKIKTPRSQFRIASKKLVNLKGCRHPRTPSFSLDNNKNKKTTNTITTNNNNKDDEATLADIDRFLFENFKSLFLHDNEETNNNNHTKRVVSEDEETDEEKDPKPSPVFDSSMSTLKEPPSFDLYGSNRFFMTHGFSGSMVDTPTTTNTNTFDEVGSSSNSSTTNTNSSPKGGNGMDRALPDNCVVLLGSSLSPYEDFRRSMEGMMEARLRNNQTVDWDFMQELLFFYINMNEKKSYKFILSAFVDLISVMRRGSEADPTKPQSVRTVRNGRR